MRYFIYARKSTEEDDRQILSIEAQLTELREFAVKENLAIVACFTESKTAKQPGRTVFGEMLSLIERGKADGIVSWAPDRLARNSVDGGRVIHMIDQGFIKSLKFPTFWCEPTPQGLFMLNIAFGQSKYFVDNLRENVKRGLRQKIRNGVWPGWAPVGYLNNPKTRGIDIDQEKGSLVRKMFELYATGEYTLQSLHQWGKDHNLTGNLNKHISMGNIYNLLQNIFYLGLMRYNGEVHEGKHEPLIEKKLFDAVQKMLRERGKPTKHKKHSDFLFLGLMKCTCGAAITAEKQKGHHYYRCTKKKGPCEEKHFLREEVLIEQIREYLHMLALSDEDTEKVLTELEKDREGLKQQVQEKVKLFQNEMEMTEARLEKLLDVFLSDIITRDEYAARKQKLLTEKLELQEKIHDIGQTNASPLEPAKSFVLSLNHADKLLRSNDNAAVTTFLKNIGSNHRLQNRRFSFSANSPYNLVAGIAKYPQENLTISAPCRILKITRTFFGPAQSPKIPPEISPD